MSILSNFSQKMNLSPLQKRALLKFDLHPCKVTNHSSSSQPQMCHQHCRHVQSLHDDEWGWDRHLYKNGTHVVVGKLSFYTREEV